MDFMTTLDTAPSAGNQQFAGSVSVGFNHTTPSDDNYDVFINVDGYRGNDAFVVASIKDVERLRDHLTVLLTVHHREQT